MTESRHTWGEKFSKEKYSFMNVCTVCGCIRTTYPKIKYVSYRRSGIAFSTNRPECVNMKLENQKTID